MKRSTGPWEGSRFQNFLSLSKEESEEKSSRLSKWIQKDLEDQINEEKLNNMTVVIEKQKIKTSDVISFLREGYTRYKKGDKGVGSIQEKYGLTTSETKRLFQYAALVNKRSSPGGRVSFEIEDENIVEVPLKVGEVSEEVLIPTTEDNSVLFS